MPQGDKDAYSDKQKRQAEHIEESVKERGGSEKEAGRIAWATVNKQDGGAKGKGAKKSSKKKSTGATKKKSSGAAKKKSTGAAKKKSTGTTKKKSTAAKKKS